MLPVEIEVKPGGDPSTVNIGSQGVIAVVVFTTENFDAALVDPTTVVFAGAFAVQHALEDVDGDGDLDMVLHFRVQDTCLREIYDLLLADDLDGDGILDSNRQEVDVSLAGETVDDIMFGGYDQVDLLLSGKELRNLLENLLDAGVLE